MTKGKKKCELLKAVRCKVAKENGISYTFTECTHQGECRGTCPKCEEELRYLTRELEKLKQSGKRVAVAGVAAALIGTAAVGCTDFGGTQGDIAAPIESEDVDGGIALPTEDQVIMGDFAEPVETEEWAVVGDMVYIPTLPEWLESSAPDSGALDFLTRETVRDVWSEYLTGQFESSDTYLYDGVEVWLTYDSAGMLTEVECREMETPDGGTD